MFTDIFHILLISSLYVGIYNTSHTRARVCYCSRCLEQSFCHIKEGGCYEKIINNTYHIFGCWGIDDYNAKCNLSEPSIRYLCCNQQDWCNAKQNDSSPTFVVTRETEDNGFEIENLWCFCNTCGSNYTCMTNSLCYRDVSGNKSRYGCMEDGRFTWGCYSTHRGHLAGDGTLNSSKQCCYGEHWCNFDSRTIQNIQHNPGYNKTLKYLTIRWVRFKEKDRGLFSAKFNVRPRNRIKGTFQFEMFNVVTKETIFPRSLVNRDFTFDAINNVLYNLKFTPIIGNYTVGSTKDLFFARVYKFVNPWLPANLEIDLNVPTIVICNVYVMEMPSLSCNRSHWYTVRLNGSISLQHIFP